MIEEKLAKVVQIKENIRLAINNKGIDTSINDPFNSYANKINNISSVSRTDDMSELADVNFWDLYGNIVYKYSASEFLNLQELPSIPSESGLVAQCWNWSLSDAKEHVQENQFLDIGPNYITDTGNTRIYLNIDDSFINKEFSPCITWDTSVPTVKRKVNIDWGDGSAIQSFGTSGVATLYHTYTQKGNYVMRFIVVDPDAYFYLGITTSYPSIFGYWYQSPKEGLLGAITRIEIGKNVKGSGRIGGNNTTFISFPNYGNYFTLLGANYNINTLSHLKLLCYPKTITSLAAHSNSIMSFLKASPLPKCNVTSIPANFSASNIKTRVVNIPNNITSVGASAFDYCYNIERVSIPSSVVSIGNYAFRNNFSLKTLKLHQGLTTLGTGAFSGCSSLEEINIPQGVTTIPADCFRNCKSCTSITIPNTVTSIGTYAFSYSNVFELNIPGSVTTLNSYSFAYNTNVNTITLHEGLTTISDYAFRNTYYISDITIPSTVTTMGKEIFYINNGYAQTDLTVRMLPTTPPTAGASMFAQRTSNNKKLKIIVPQGTLQDYQTATNWSTYASYMEEETPSTIEP